jgi:beta-phosphoglucomutase-like phosphatase (HAD superfamily)
MQNVPFDLVAFDGDRVLVDTESLVNRVFLRLVSANGPILDEIRANSAECGSPFQP